jgi:ferredoxin-thioredoxin reductase catalytic subunit
MNEKGRDGTLYCDQKMEFQCPCGGLTRMLEEDGKCWKGVFVKEA